MKRSLVVIAITGWVLAAAILWLEWQVATLQLTAATKARAEQLDNDKVFMLYAGIVMLVTGLLVARHAPRRQKLLVVSGPLVTIVVFVAGVLRMVLVLMGAHIT